VTPPRPPDAGPAVVIADGTCAGVLSQVIADAFVDLAVSRWLVPDPAARRRIFPGYFRLSVEHALAGGIVCTTPGQDSVALWLPVGGGTRASARGLRRAAGRGDRPVGRPVPGL